MIAIADYGGSKSDWAFLDDNFGTIHEFKDIGFNPNTAGSTIEIAPTILELLSKCTAIHIYAAGVITQGHKELFIEYLRKHTEAIVKVQSDVLSCARALYNNKPGMLAMLGTGSMVARYDGKSITDISPSLGYILSDEGSGTDLAKYVLRSYYYGTMPTDIKNAFQEKYSLTRAAFLHQLKTADNKATYLADYSYFLFEHKSTEWAQKIINSSFNLFYEQRVLPLIEKSNESIGFVGSVAYLYRDELSVLFTHLDCSISKIISSPMLGLIEYHKSNR